MLVVAGAAAYFALSAFVLPQLYLSSSSSLLALAPPAPAPAITEVALSEKSVTPGQPFLLRVEATNRGQHADLQLVSIAFPNATSTVVAEIQSYTFRQSPVFINPGRPLVSGYQDSRDATVPAVYPAIEAWSMPWEPGESFEVSLAVTPHVEGRFVVFVKAVGLPHSHGGAHYPQSGVLDQQGQYVAVYEVDVTAVAKA